MGDQKKQSSSITTTDKDFGPQLQRNNIVFINPDARSADDADKIRELLDRLQNELPDKSAYNKYLTVTQECQNEATIQNFAYPLLSKRLYETRVSGYEQRANYIWSEVDNHLTAGLSNAKPDIFESYCRTSYPPDAIDALSSALAPTSNNMAMPAFAVEVKGYSGNMEIAQMQCAYNGALMTEGARAVHTYTGQSDNDFYGKTQALTVAFNGRCVEYYGHHALRTGDTIEYHSYPLKYDIPLFSFSNYRDAYKHMRNAQDIGCQWATERKDRLWAYTRGGAMYKGGGEGGGAEGL